MKTNIVLILLVLGLYGCSGGTGGTGGSMVPQPTFITVNGQANKGPFADDATVTVTGLTTDGGTDTTTNDSVDEDGMYALRIEEDTVNLISVEGTYFSEITGAFTEESIEISGVFAGGEDDDANVNVLTHLIHDRVRELMSASTTAQTAIDMAEDELTLALSEIIPSPSTDVSFNELVVLNALQEEPTAEGNAYLLALSATFEQHAVLRSQENGTSVVDELADILNDIADDLASDGEVDLTEAGPALSTAQRSLNPNEIHENLFEFDSEFKEQVVSSVASAPNSEDLNCAVNLDQVRCFDNEDSALQPEAVVEVEFTSIVADMNQFIDSDGDGLVNSEDSDDDGDGIDDDADSRPFDATLLVPAQSSDQFATYVKAGLRQWSGVDSGTNVRTLESSPFDEGVGIAVPAAESVDSQQVLSRDSNDALAADGFTTTNVLVAGVDEIDPVKYDGEYMYIANNSDVQVLRTDNDGSAAEVIGRIDVGGESAVHHIQGMYLTADADTIVTVSGGSDVRWLADWFAPWHWNGKTRIDLIDVTDAEALSTTETLELDGSYVNSRRIGDTLYMITRFTPTVDELIRPADTDEEKEANERLIEETETDELLPKVTFSDGSSENLVVSDNCFLPPTSDEEEVQYPTLTTISAINLTNPRDLTSVCLTDGIQGMHMSLDAIYVAALDSGRPGIGFYNNTVIHKFSIADTVPSYIGSGVVDGGFWGDPTFLMGEHEGNLTVVTTQQNFSDRNFEHVTILGEGEKEFQLAQLGRIPNEDSKDVIGKPGEQIFASRIFGDRAYIVTFEQVDPVYVIDIGDPTSPEILGELEIPGFSTYLHPISDDLLLGVGRDTTTVDGRPVFEGINLRLFDVSVPSELNVMSEVSIGRRGTETPVSWNPHAFTILRDPSTGTHRVTVPVRVHGAHVEEDDEREPWSYYPWTHEALYMFEVSASGLIDAGIMVANDFDTGYRFAPNCCSWNERSFLDGDLVHYLRNNRLYTAFWDTPEDASEAFIPTVFASDEATFCTEELRNGLNVGIGDRITGERLSCASVTATEGDFSTTVYQGCTEDGDKVETLVAEGLYERPGTYNVTVTLDGYEEWTGTDVVIQADQCHVHPTFLGVFLEPAEE